jgi:hypothetical protein
LLHELLSELELLPSPQGSSLLLLPLWLPLVVEGELTGAGAGPHSMDMILGTRLTLETFLPGLESDSNTSIHIDGKTEASAMARSQSIFIITKLLKWNSNLLFLNSLMKNKYQTDNPLRATCQLF